ncbi:MAG: glycosyltransferase [candidate division Zixibacteria bacterium]|nr:glycosyltransferase [candidate division Zixibacteria bacterium]
MAQPLISVIIPAYKSEKTIEDCLKGACNQYATFEHEIIVVDSSPDERTADIVRKFPEVRLIRTKDRLTPGQARNYGAEHAKADYLAFTDSDTEIPSNWLEEIKKTIDRGHDLIAGAIGNSPNNDTSWSRAEYYFEFSEHSPYREEGSSWFAGSCNFICRKEPYMKAGGFPVHRGGEDVVLSSKLEKLGLKTLFNPKVVVYHQNRKAISKIRYNTVMLGKFSALFRKQGVMKNYGIINRPLICWAFIPLFTIYKVIGILRRTLGSNDPRKWELVQNFPNFFAIMMWWMTGFYIGAYGKDLDITI